jgi:hypothetical protein
MTPDKKLVKLASSNGKKLVLLDRLREHLFTGGKYKISNRDQETLDKLTEVDKFLTTGYSDSNIVKKIETKMNLSQAQAYKLVKDARQLFGDLRVQGKNGMRHVLYEMYMRGAQKALKAGDIQTYIHATDSIARLYGLFDSTVTIDMKGLVMPAVVYANGDIETLKKELEEQTRQRNIKNGIETEYTNYESV